MAAAAQVLQVVVSFAVYRQPLNVCYMVGGGAVVAALWWLHKTEHARERAGLRAHQPLLAMRSLSPVNAAPDRP